MNDNPYSSSALKRSAAHFLAGKVVSALLTITTLLWLVRLLNINEYGIYVTLTASFDIALTVTGLGLSWIDARYLPEFRLHAPKKVLARFIAQLVQLQFVVLLLVAMAAWLCLDWFLLKTDMVSHAEAVQLYLLILVVEGTGSRIRNSILHTLLLQGLSQISTVIRSFIFIAVLGVLFYQGEVNLLRVVAAELLASLISVLFSLLGLWRYLISFKEADIKPNWIIPKWSEMWGVAHNMYLSVMVSRAYSAEVFILLVSYYMGSEATAVFGFIRNLYSQVLSYLPAALLFGLIRPKLVASYVGNGGIVELTRNSNLVGKLSLFVLMPLLVLAWLMGEELVAELSGGKFLHSGHYLAGLFCAAVPFSQRQILETVAVVTGSSQLCNYASILGILTLPITYVLIQLNFGLWAPIIAVTLGNIIFCSTILNGVVKKTSYRADFMGFYKMLLSALLAYLGSLLIIFPAQSWTQIVIATILVSSIFLLVAAIIKPFSEDERLRINQLIKRNLFIW